MSTGSERPRRADLVILTALTLEYQAAMRVDAGAWEGSRWEEEPGPHGLPVAFRTFKGSGERPLRVVLAQAGEAGAVAATQALIPLVQAYRPRCVAMCGVCAGRRGKTNLGDVIAAERLFFYDTGKKLPDEVQQDLRTYLLRQDWKVALERFDFLSRFHREAWWLDRPVPFEWQELWALAKLDEGLVEPWTHPEFQRACPQWEQVIAALWASGDVQEGTCALTEKGRKRIRSALLRHKNRLPDFSPQGSLLPFKVHVAPMGSGSQVMEDESVWGVITSHLRTTLGLEMEAAALGALAYAHRSLGLDVLVLKGVMDFANAGRDDQFKQFAARASAECLLAFIREHLELEVIPGIDDLLVSGTDEALPASPPPSALLSARYEVVPFHEGGRMAVLEELERWCEENRSVAVRLLHAEGGIGKTRLAIEWIRRRRKAGWAAGFLAKEVPDDWFVRLWELGQPVVVVIDYAESRSDLRAVLMHLYRYQQQGTGSLRRVRLLLLARGAEDWWQSLRQTDAGLGAWLDMTPPYELAPLAVSEGEREKVFHEAARRFAEKLGRPPSRRASPHFSDERFTRVLYLHMAALASVEELPFAANTLLDVILEHEERFWETRARQGEIALSRQRSLAREVVAAATLRGGLPHFLEARRLVTKLLDRSPSSDEEELLLLLQRIYQGTGEDPALFLPPLAPDLLGEGMVLRVLSPKLQGDRPPPDWMDRVFTPDAPVREVKTGLEVLGRASASWPEQVRPWLSRLLTPLQVRAALALEAAKAVGQHTGLSVLGDVLAERLEQEGDLKLALALWRRKEPWGVSLRRVNEWAARTLLPVIPTADDEKTGLARAHLLRQRARGLYSMGRHGEAITVARESLETLRPWARDDSAGILVELALGLRTLGNALRDSGRYEDALTADEEAIAIFRGLIQRESQPVEGGLAEGLTNKSAALIQLGRHPEALAAAEEAVALLRPLERSVPETHRGSLFAALLNMSIASSALGRPEQGLKLMEEFLPHSRARARQNPDVYHLDLALLLLNMGHALNAAGRHDEAVAAGKEAVDIYRLFARRDPKAYQHLFTQSLINLSVWLLELGRHAEAITALREAIGLIRPFAESDPSTHSRKLATCFFTLGINQAALGQNEEAVSSFRGAVRYLRDSEPADKELVTYLKPLGQTLRKLGRNEEALAALEEAIAAIWPVFESNPAQFAPETASLLHSALELIENHHVAPSLDLLDLLERFSRLAPRPGGEDKP